MPIKLEMLRCYVTVARSGNLVDAANILGRTPSAVSMMLKQFEDQLGSPLFESGRKSRLTALGRFTLDEARREVEHFDHSVAMITSYAHANAGLVRVATVPSIAGSFLPKVMQLFLRDHPDVTIDIRDMDSAGVHRELEKERIDIGIATGAGAGAVVQREPLFSDAFGIVCPMDHPLTRAKHPLSWEALKDIPFITNGLCEQIIDETFQNIISASNLRVRNTTSLLAMVREGVGVTVVPRLVIRIAEQGLAFLPVADTNARRNIEILRRADAALSPAAQVFQETVRSIAQEIIEEP